MQKSTRGAAEVSSKCVEAEGAILACLTEGTLEVTSWVTYTVRCWSGSSLAARRSRTVTCWAASALPLSPRVLRMAVFTARMPGPPSKNVTFCGQGKSSRSATWPQKQ